MRLLLSALFIILAFGTFFPAPVSAAGTFADELSQQTGAFAGTQGASLGTPNDPRLVVAKIIRSLLTVVGILFLVYTLYAGYLILTSRGDEQKIEKGKSTLRTAIIGVIVTLSAYTILRFIDNTIRQQSQRPTDGSYYESDTREFNPCTRPGFNDPTVCP